MPADRSTRSTSGWHLLTTQLSGSRPATWLDASRAAVGSSGTPVTTKIESRAASSIDNQPPESGWAARTEPETASRISRGPRRVRGRRSSVRAGSADALRTSTTAPAVRCSPSARPRCRMAGLDLRRSTSVEPATLARSAPTSRSAAVSPGPDKRLAPGRRIRVNAARTRSSPRSWSKKPGCRAGGSPATKTGAPASASAATASAVAAGIHGAEASSSVP